jgi:hypothetical protein
MLRTTISFALHTIKVFYFFFYFTHTYKSCTEIVKNSLKIVCTVQAIMIDRVRSVRPKHLLRHMSKWLKNHESLLFNQQLLLKMDFYFLFTIVMKVLISCTENPNFFIEVLDELELLIDKKVIFDETKISIGPPSARRLPSVSKFCNPHNFFSFQPRHFSFCFQAYFFSRANSVG